MSESSAAAPKSATRAAPSAPPPPTERLVERKIALDGSYTEFPLERWLVSERLVVGRWVADADPRAMERFPAASGFTSWGVWWPGLPYGAYRIHRPDGSLRLYRLDALEDARCDGEIMSFRDLLLDALILPDGAVQIEDEDEVEEALAAGRLNVEQRWRIAWTKSLFAERSELLTRRIDAAIAEAVEAMEAMKAAGS